MIVGTAGHIDHGKTTLVRALTGVDTDRLPQEKARGISIELGYAFMDGPGGERIGFIDVPGHERLVHTMLAGATGIDFALLLVAADDGVMPQTREHLAALSLLDVGRGAVALTKIDRADAARQDAVCADVRDMLRGTPLASVPVFPVAASTGHGVDALREHLVLEAAAARPRDDVQRAFRLAVDRVFSLDGVGTVVTGTVHAGRVEVGDEVRLVPGSRRARVRGVHAQNRASASAEAGQRCALALAGVEREQVERGQWCVQPEVAFATDRLDASLTLWRGEGAPLRSGTRVHVHIGSAALLGSVAVLDPMTLAPGACGLVQIVLQRPVGAWHGDPVVLRDAAASRTLAGGRVLDPLAPARYRRTPQRLAELSAWQLPTSDARLTALIDRAPLGLDLRRFSMADGRRGAAVVGGSVLRQTEGDEDWAWRSGDVDAAAQVVRDALAELHRRQPDELGPDAARLRRLTLPRLAEPLWRAMLGRLRAHGQIGLRGAFVHLPDHAVRLSAAEERLAQKLAPALDAAGFEGAWVRDLARDGGESEPLVRVTLARLAQRGELHQVVKDLYYPIATMEQLGGLARVAASGGGGEVTAARFRDATGLGRKRAIQILEYFDRIGLLRRVGDVHRLRTDSGLFADEPRRAA